MATINVKCLYWWRDFTSKNIWQYRNYRNLGHLRTLLLHIWRRVANTIFRELSRIDTGSYDISYWKLVLLLKKQICYIFHSKLSDWLPWIFIVIRSAAAADRRTPLKPGAQLDLASPYAVPRARRTESPTSLNYAKLCVELNYTGTANGEMWDDLVIRHIVLE